MRMTDEMLYLDRNENLYGPAPACFEALRQITVEQLSVYSRDFLRGVKSRLSERLARELNIPETQVLLSEGSEDMLKQAVHCYLGPGERMLCPAQSWWYYRTVATEVGGETITYSLKRENDRYEYDAGGLIRLYEQHSPRVVLIASPNNPTGNSFPDGGLKQLTEALRESIVILDEAYWGFREPSNEHIPDLIGRYRNLVVLRTFSKYFALAGARIGYAAVGTGLSRLSKFSSRYLGYNQISEALALAALDSPQYYAAISDKVRVDRLRYYEFFDQVPGAQYFRSDANFVLVWLPRPVIAPLQEYLAARKLAIKFFKEPEFEDCVRITVGTTEQNHRLLGALGEFFHHRKVQPETP